jgi:hypothetical protein
MDLREGKVTTLIAFSQGHWSRPKEALGDKRNPEDLQRWRGLAEMGNQTARYMLSEQGQIVERFKGKGKLEPINDSDPVF